jgi:FkbM family methyltransferase
MGETRRRFLKGAASRLGLAVERVDEQTFVVWRPGGRRRLVRLGDGRIGVHLLVDDERVRRYPGMVQKRVSEFLAAEQVAWLLRATQTDLVLDVGANVGQYALALRRAGYAGRIISFEPVSEPFRALARSAAGDPAWEVRNHALGAEDGTAEINITPGTMSSMLAASEFGRGWSDKLEQTSLETIEVRRLDGVFDELTHGRPARAYLKLDTQGFDLEVFRGAGDALRSVVAMQSEVACLAIYDGMPRLQEQLTAYEDAGFETVGMYPVSRDPKTLRVIEFDLLMVRADEVRRPRH